jgi:hypothetical protein
MKMKLLGLVTLVLIVGFSMRYTVTNKPVYVTSDHFLEECGYEMPKADDKVVVNLKTDGVLKLDFSVKVVKVIYTGYEKKGDNNVYLKVVNPLFMLHKPYMEFNCQNIQLHVSD